MRARQKKARNCWRKVKEKNLHLLLMRWHRIVHASGDLKNVDDGLYFNFHTSYSSPPSGVKIACRDQINEYTQQKQNIPWRFLLCLFCMNFLSQWEMRFKLLLNISSCFAVFHPTHYRICSTIILKVTSYFQQFFFVPIFYIAANRRWRCRRDRKEETIKMVITSQSYFSLFRIAYSSIYYYYYALLLEIEER